MITGRIYDLTDGVMHYYGSTINDLSVRKTKHKYEARRTPSKAHKYFNNVGWDNIHIILIEEKEFEDDRALRLYEGEIIKSHINDTNCLNCHVMGRTYKEYVDDTKDKRNAYARMLRAKKRAERLLSV